MALTALFWNKEEDSARSQAWKKIKIFYRSALTGLLLCPHPLPSKRGLLQLRLKRKKWLATPLTMSVPVLMGQEGLGCWIYN